MVSVAAQYYAVLHKITKYYTVLEMTASLSWSVFNTAVCTRKVPRLTSCGSPKGSGAGNLSTSAPALLSRVESTVLDLFFFAVHCSVSAGHRAAKS